MRIHTVPLIAALALTLPSLAHAQSLIVPGDPPGMVGEGFFSGPDGVGVYQCEAGGCSYIVPESDGGMGFGMISGGAAGAFRSDCATNRPCRFTWQPALLPPQEFGLRPTDPWGRDQPRSQGPRR